MSLGHFCYSLDGLSTFINCVRIIYFNIQRKEVVLSNSILFAMDSTLQTQVSSSKSDFSI